jgi:cytochrome c-type biogenesis protein CcmH
MLRLRALLTSVLFALLLAPAFAVEPGEELADPALEARARALSSQLRCLVCQNQSIDDSHATLAKDLRLLVRERLKAGDSDIQVRDFLVARYGDFILLKPPLNAGTILLWAGPFLLLLAGAGAMVIGVRRRRRVGEPHETDLTAEEKTALARLTGEGQ